MKYLSTLYHAVNYAKYNYRLAHVFHNLACFSILN